MTRCEAIHPVLHRAAEGETSPAESLRVASHLSRCTACRIVLARERRLATMLATIDDPLPVDPDFTRRVMGALPEGPPAASPVRARRRGLAIAGLAGVVVFGVGELFRLLGSAPSSAPLPGFPRLTFEGFESLNEIFGGLVRFFVLILARAGSGFETSLAGWHPGAITIPTALLSAVLAFVALSMLVALAAGGYSGAQSIPRVFIRLFSLAGGTPNRIAVAERSPRSPVNARRME